MRPYALVALSWFLLASPAGAAELCGAAVPPSPSPSTPASSLSFESPPLQLIPVGYADTHEITRGGRFYDSAGRVYTFRDVEAFVQVYIQGVEEAVGTTTAAYYDGPYTTVFVPTRQGPPVAYKVPSDSVAWKKAGIAAANARKTQAGVRRDRRKSFSENLCSYNRSRAADLFAQQQATALAAIRDETAPGVPLSAFAMADQLDEDLDLQRPTDAAGIGADATAVWGLVTRIGDPSEATSRLVSARSVHPEASNLAALVAVVP